MATETEKLLLRVEAQTKAARAEIQKLQKSVKQSTGKMEKSFKGPTMALRGLETQAGRTAAIMRGRLLGAIVAVAAPAALISLSKRATEAADNIAKVADKVGLSTDALQELRFAATQAGVNTNTFDMAMQRLSRRIGEALQGKGELIDTLIKYKIAVRDAAGNTLPLDNIIGQIAEKIKGAKSQQEALTIAFKAFDSEGAALVNMLRGGKQGLDAVRQEARDLGIVLSEDLVRGAEKTANKMDVLGTILRAKVNAAILENASAIDAVVTAAIKAVAALGTLIQRLGQFLGLADAVDKRVQLEAVNRGLNTVPKSGGIFMLDPLPKRVRDAIRKELGMDKNQMTVTLAPSFTSNSGSARIRKILQQERQRIISEQMNDLPPQARLPETTVTAKQLPKKAGASKSKSATPGENITRTLAEQIAKLREQRTELGLTGQALEQYQATQAAASVIARGLKDLTAEQREKLVELKSATELVNFVKTEKLKLTEQEKALTVGLIERLNQEALANMRVKEATERAKQAKEQLAQAAGSVAQSFEDALISSLDRTGDAMENLKNIARGLVSDLLKQFTRLAIINPILNSLGLGGGPRGSALPTVSDIKLPSFASSGSGTIPGLASGGPVSPGMPHIVGERGPELFVPKGAGSVVPNHKMGGGMTVIMDNRGADAGQIAALRNDLRAMNASFEERAISAVLSDRLKGGRMRRAFA